VSRGGAALQIIPAHCGCAHDDQLNCIFRTKVHVRGAPAGPSRLIIARARRGTGARAPEFIKALVTCRKVMQRKSLAYKRHNEHHLIARTFTPSASMTSSRQCI
jgi:hypothetical protein